ncbi:DUF2934 domain-containing protein (plasmid) [Ensifer sp. D2-11]
MKTDDEELTRRRAYELWEKAGRPDGDGLRYWFQAANEIESTRVNGADVLENAAVFGEPDEPALATKANKAPNSAASKQPDSAKSPKRRTVSKPGDKTGKRTENR